MEDPAPPLGRPDDSMARGCGIGCFTEIAWIAWGLALNSGLSWGLWLGSLLTVIAAAIWIERAQVSKRALLAW